MTQSSDITNMRGPAPKAPRDFDHAKQVGYDSHAFGLAKRCVHLGWCAAYRAAWSLGYQEAARMMDFGKLRYSPERHDRIRDARSMIIHDASIYGSEF